MGADDEPVRSIGTDPAAFTVFYRAHVDEVMRFVTRRVADPQLAADLTAEVFLAVIEAAAGGTLGLLRDLAGFTGLAFLVGAVLGGALAGIGPLGYLAITVPALGGHWTTPWLWPARPPHDRGAAICAGLVFAAGLAVVTVRGARARNH